MCPLPSLILPNLFLSADAFKPLTCCPNTDSVARAHLLDGFASVLGLALVVALALDPVSRMCLLFCADQREAANEESGQGFNELPA